MKDHWQNITERFEVTSEMAGHGTSPRIVGSALRKGTERFFKLKLRLFPWHTYYLSPDLNSRDSYVLYSGMSFEKDARKFYHPVGHAHRVGLGIYYRILIPDLKIYFFMRLNPKDHYYEEQAS